MGQDYDLERNIISMIKRDEGYRGTPYRDTKGYLTIGYGFCLDRLTLPKKVADVWLVEIIKEKSWWLANSNVNHIYRELNTDRKCAILNMCYQLGVNGCIEFSNMWAALGAGDYETAAQEAQDSQWYKQTPSRAKRVSDVIRTGNMSSYQAVNNDKAEV